MCGSSFSRLLVRLSSAGGRAAAWVTALAVGGPFFFHLARGSKAYLGLFEDDYFYYAIVADRLVSRGKVTYDGATLTNGFHPLWFAVVATVRLLCGRFGTAFYVVLALVFVASMMATYELSRRFARSLGASAVLAPPVAAFFALATGRLLASGMETAIAVPLLLWLFVEVAREEALTTRRAAKLGFVASLAILARLDIAIVVAILVLAWLVLGRTSTAGALRILAAFCAGGSLLAVYLATNLFVFGGFLPVSAVAKQLDTGRGVNIDFLRFVATNTLYGPVVAVLLPLGVIAFAASVRRNPHLRPAARLAGGAALLFPLVFYGVNALTGWAFFGWYAYPLPPAIVAALVFACEWAAPMANGPARFRAAVLAGALALAVVSVRAVRYFFMHGPKWSVADNALLAMAVELADRMRHREGVFGMGAMAGFASYLVDKPFVQLEGLVCDRAMVEHVRRQDALEDVLRAYHVDYLVVSVARLRLHENNGCYAITEPSVEWAGPHASKMSGEICSEPIARFANARSSDPWASPFSLETLIFDLRGASWRKTRME